MRGIAQDLGVCRGTLRGWLHRWGTGGKTGPDGAPAPSPLKPKTDLGDRTGTQPPAEESMEERVARLEAANAALRAERAKLTREREILQQAAKYFAGETIW